MNSYCESLNVTKCIQIEITLNVIQCKRNVSGYVTTTSSLYMKSKTLLFAVYLLVLWCYQIRNYYSYLNCLSMYCCYQFYTKNVKQILLPFILFYYVILSQRISTEFFCLLIVFIIIIFISCTERFENRNPK